MKDYMKWWKPFCNQSDFKDLIGCWQRQLPSWWQQFPPSSSNEWEVCQLLSLNSVRGGSDDVNKRLKYSVFLIVYDNYDVLLFICITEYLVLALCHHKSNLFISWEMFLFIPSRSTKECMCTVNNLCNVDCSFIQF